MKIIKGFKCLTSQQFAEQTSCFSLIWSKMYVDRKLLNIFLQVLYVLCSPENQDSFFTTLSYFLSEFLLVAFTNRVIAFGMNP